MFRTLISLGLTVLIAGCSAAPEGIEPVENFELNRYLGKWYEIARLDHSFERELTEVTAQYSLREDGGVKVVNRGFNEAKGEWSEAIGKAYFVEEPDRSHLKVSFFGPFYGAYVIFELDPDYQYSFVAGPDRDYLWLLSRTPQVPDTVMKRFLERAKALGFDTEQLIFSGETS
ncbi:lipocalin family protein [Pseudomonadota bacterium]